MSHFRGRGRNGDGGMGLWVRPQVSSFVYRGCASYSSYSRCRGRVFGCHSFPGKVVVPGRQYSRGAVCFLVSNSIQMADSRRPSAMFRSKRFVVRPVNSHMRFRVLRSARYVLCLFRAPRGVYASHFGGKLRLTGRSPVLPVIVSVYFPLHLFVGKLGVCLGGRLLYIRFLGTGRARLCFLLGYCCALGRVTGFCTPVCECDRAFHCFIVRGCLGTGSIRSFTRLKKCDAVAFQHLFGSAFKRPTCR